MEISLTDYLTPLSSALKERDINTAAHSNRTSCLALELGQQCGLRGETLAVLCVAARVHDVGKIGIPDDVLHKPGKLDAEEWSLMKTHSERGYGILSSVVVTGIEEIALAVRHHHEGYDGSGYPAGMAGDDIPILSRIIALADSYDAMSEIRPYHAAKSHQQIMKIMCEENAGKYDPHLLAKFCKLLETSAFRVQ
jgi:HD-GYP domain-containing protein (c-di-GMP phosphodiesterase class II)